MEDASSLVRPVRVVITSFGFGHGEAPPQADITLDARRLFRNPHHDPAMREMTGHDAVVRDHVMNTPGVSSAVESLTRFAWHLLADLGDKSEAQIHVAVGCSGGRHRAVAISEEVSARLADLGAESTVRHCDVGKPVLRSSAGRRA